ncbi:MAG: HD domain-containing phosphohydrolase [Christensenellales bacterium]|jgi:HD-GYP domain-containing protein (c-di-GMP phosphodiesterase class II)
MPRIDKTKISMYDLLVCLTNAEDIISHEVADHHQRVAYLAFRIGERLNLPLEQKKNLMLAGLLHDMGAFSLNERLSLIENEPPNVNDHAFRGARLIEGFAPLAEASSIIRHHHVPWEYGAGRMFQDMEVSQLSHILHLADRIAVSIEKDINVLDQSANIRQKILRRKGSIFVPELVDAFVEISDIEYIWLDMTYKPLLYILPNIVLFDTIELNLGEIIDLTNLFAGIIDFRNPFTANHTAGVANTAKKLAKLAGFSKNECKMMLVAGNLHDLGKLAVSRDILDKPGMLEADEQSIIRSHTFYTFRLLQAIEGFETINKWASLHHEKLNGTGYPFHLNSDNIPLGSRIMAVADIFTAISEDRPYRKGMTTERVVSILSDLVKDNSICPYVVSILLDNLETMNEIRREAQQQSKVRYDHVMKPIG